LYGIGILPPVPILQRGPEIAISPRFLRVVATTFVLFGSMHVAGYAIWWRRPWGRIVLLVALPIYFLVGFLPGLKQGAIYWLSIVVLSFAFAMLVVPAKALELAPSVETAPSRDAGSAVGILAACVAVLFLALAIAFRRIGHPLTISAAIAISGALVALLVLCRWRPWNRVIGIVLVAAAACDLLAAFALVFVDLSQLPPLARIPILATSGFLYRAAFGASLDVLVAGFMEGAVPGAAALFVLGVPFLLSPPRPPASAVAKHLQDKAVPVLASAAGVALAIPITIQMFASPPLPPSRGPAIERASIESAPNMPQPPPPPPPPPERIAGPEGPVGAMGSGTAVPNVGGIVGTPAETPKIATMAAPLAVAIGSLAAIKKVQPEYPTTAKASGRSGVAMIRATIARDGSVGKVENVRGDRDDFVEAAMRAMQQWRFVPYSVDGAPREITTGVTFRFKAD